jgi:hypothetical protein
MDLNFLFFNKQISYSNDKYQVTIVLQISNKRFIHSPAEKKPEFYDKSLAVSENQIKVSRSGIIDKTEMNEAVDNLGMKCAIWVKYRLSLFHYNYNK